MRLDALPVEAVVAAKEFALFERPSESSDGEWIAYCVTATPSQSSRVRRLGDDFQKTGLSSAGEYGDIWITNIKNGRSRSITEGIGSNWSPVWSPNGRYLAFYSNRPGAEPQGQTKLWMWDRASNKLKQVSDVPVRAIREPVWLPASDRVLATTLPEGDSSQSRVPSFSPPPVKSRSENLSTVKVYRAAPLGVAASEDGSKTEGFVNLARPAFDFSIVNIADGTVRRVIRDAHVWRYAVSPDRSHVVMSVAKRYAKKGGYAVLFDLIDYDLVSGSSFVAASDVLLSLFQDHVSWSQDGIKFSYQTSGPSADGSVYVVDVLKKQSRIVSGTLPAASTKGYPLPGYLPLWDGAGQTVYFLIGNDLWRTSVVDGIAEKLATLPGTKLSLIPRDGSQVWSTSQGTLMLQSLDPVTKQSTWYRANEEKKSFETILTEPKRYTGYPHFEVVVSHDARHIIYLAEDAQNEPNLWIADAALSDRRRLTDINPQYSQYEMGRSQLIEWRDIDGNRLQGALLLPAGYDRHKRYPLVVEVYGGVALSDNLNRFGVTGVVNGQMFATRGYVVLQPDAPQSEGTPMVDLMKTIMPGVDKAVDLGIADPDRIGVMGQSYGGYSVFSLIVQTTRFKAAAAVSGVADLVGLYGQMSPDGATYGQPGLEHGQFLLGGSPWSHRNLYIENSPIFYLDRVNTPILIIHGSEDSASSVFHGDEEFVDLRRLGKEVSYAKYMGEDHAPGNWSYANQIDFLNRIVEWFDGHLKR